MKNTIFALAITLALTGCNLQEYADAQISKTLVQTANTQNKSLPMMVDSDTRWDSAVAGPGKTWTYLYTIVVPEAKTLTNEKINAYLGSKIRNSVCTAKEMEFFVKNDVRLKYIYRDLDGNVIGEVDFNTGECK